MSAPAIVTERIASLQPAWFPNLRGATDGLARLRRLVAIESVILTLICLLDLSSTLFWVAYRDAAEANPLMAYYLNHHGVGGFVAAKFVFLAMPLLIAEWARRHSPHFVRNALRLTICCYLTFYVIGVAQINGGAVAAAHAVGIHTPTGANDVPDDTGYVDPTDAD